MVLVLPEYSVCVCVCACECVCYLISGVYHSFASAAELETEHLMSLPIPGVCMCVCVSVCVCVLTRMGHIILFTPSSRDE